MKSSKLTAAIIGFIAMVATVLIYVLFSDDIFGTTIVWLSMVMLLISEAVFTVKAICTQSSIIAQSSIVISAAHFALTLLLALIFIFAFEDSIKTYVILNILALCGALAVDAAIFHFSSAVSASIIVFLVFAKINYRQVRQQVHKRSLCLCNERIAVGKEKYILNPTVP